MKIDDQIQNTEHSQVTIAKEVTDEVKNHVPRSTVIYYAKDKLVGDAYKERFPADRDKYPEHVNIAIEDKIRKTKLDLGAIAETLTKETGIEVTRDKIRYYAETHLPVEEYLERFPGDYYHVLGIITHKFLEGIFFETMQNMGIKIKSEAKIREDRRIDNLIFINKEFKEIFSYQFPKPIRYIAVDFSMDASKENFNVKCLKNYQAEDTILFFVPISYKKRSSDYPTPPNVPFKENIKVFPILDFINAFNFGKDTQKKLFKFINKAIEAKKTRNKAILLMLKKSVEDFKLLKDGQKIIHDFS